jgi:hypothetical protein
VHRYPPLDGRLLPFVGLSGLIVALIISAWRFEPIAESRAAAAKPSASVPADFRQLPAVRIGLRADAAGRLAAISINGRPVRDRAELCDQIKALIGPATDATVEVELDCDAKLRYEDMQRTIAAISGFSSADGRTQLPLVDRVKFLPRRGAAR